MNKYQMTAYDDGNCEYATFEIDASDMTHAMQRLAAMVPDEQPRHIEVWRLKDERAGVK